MEAITDFAMKKVPNNPKVAEDWTEVVKACPSMGSMSGDRCEAADKLMGCWFHGIFHRGYDPKQFINIL